MWAVHADADMLPPWNNTHAHKQSAQMQWCSRMWDVWRTWAILELNEVTSVPWGWEKAPAVGVSSPSDHQRDDDANSEPCRDTHHPNPRPNVPQLCHCSGPFHSPQAGLGIISLLRKKLCKSFHPLRCAQGPLTWVDILICCRQSLPAITEQRAAWKKKKADEALLTRRQRTTMELQKVRCRVVPVMPFECARAAECLSPPGRRDFWETRGSWLSESITEERLLAWRADGEADMSHCWL